MYIYGDSITQHLRELQNVSAVTAVLCEGYAAVFAYLFQSHSQMIHINKKNAIQKNFITNDRQD